MTNVIPLHPTCRYGHTAQEAHAIVVGLADDDARVLPTQHAYERMEEREVTIPQMLRILRRGDFAEPGILSEDRMWKFKFRGLTAGDEVSVVVLLDQDQMGSLIVVVTVIAH